MPLKETTHTLRNTVLPGLLNSYSMIFFLNNKFLSVVILLVTFFNFYAGLSGLLAATIALLIGWSMDYDKTTLRSGVYSFNALLTGIGMGTFFDPSFVFFSLLAIATLITFILSVTMGGWFNKNKLPFLSIPFVLSFWMILLPSPYFENLGLTQRNIYWLNEMYAMGGNSLINLVQSIDSLPINHLVETYLRAISSIFFQNNLVTGLLIALAILISSRITFSLSLLGFLTAYSFALFTGSETSAITHYNIGANYMMVAFAVGGFFLIPSRQSYFWVIILIPLTSLALLFFTKLTANVNLPVFSLPFSVVTILFVYFLELRNKHTKLILTPLQHYSPEANLYTFQNNKDRLARFLYMPIHLPFWGEWTVSQGHDGAYTHKGEWGKAFDFCIQDEAGKTFNGNGLVCEDYYCYNKPILAPADGYVEEIINYIDDNEIGQVNTENNWGNSIVIRHATGLYTQLSHLKKGTFKVSTGDYVRRGDLLANCGNSGRSPEPHVHFQMQATPFLGSKTLDYPISYYYARTKNAVQLHQFKKPELHENISNLSTDKLLVNAFKLFPNTIFTITDQSSSHPETWEVFTDAYNYTYLYCIQTDSSAYFVNDGFIFYFTAFYGNKKSLLYYFFMSAYKVSFGEKLLLIQDKLSLNLLTKNKISMWIQDSIAPFYIYKHLNYQAETNSSVDSSKQEIRILNSTINLTIANQIITKSKSTMLISEQGIEEFTYHSGKTKIHATCIKQ